MGLGIYIKGEISAFKRKSFELPTIQDFISNYSSGIFKESLSFVQNENKLIANLHPCEESVHFELSDDSIVCSAKTNSVGPGYHAYLVELVEQLGNDLGIAWSWELEEGEEYYQDETGYQQHKNFEELQIEMLRWLRALCRSYSNEEGEENQIMILLPLGFPRMKLDYFAASPVKIWNKEWFGKVAALELEDLHWAGKEFFIWWNKEQDSMFFKQTGIALLNVECTWHIPGDDVERKTFSIINQCFGQSRKIDPVIELPEDDWIAVQKLLSETETDIPQTDYGYRKHLMTFDLPGDWLIDLPGTMYRGDDEETVIFYDHIWSVRSLAYSLSKRDKTDTEFAETFFDQNKNAGAEAVYSQTDMIGKAIVYYAIDKDTDSEYWILQGVRVKDNKFLLSTICYPTDDYKDSAIEIWNSIRR